MTAVLAWGLVAVAWLLPPRRYLAQVDNAKAWAVVALAVAMIPRALAVPLDAATACAIAWPVACAVSAVGAEDRRAAWLGLHGSYDGVLHQAAYAALFLAGRGLTPEDLRTPLAVGAVGVCAYALTQVAGMDPLRWRHTARLGAYVRPMSTLGHPNHLGAWLVLAWPLCWPLWPLVVPVLLLARSRAAWAGALVALAVGGLSCETA